MADQWYYAHEGTRTGPYSSGQFRALAVAGNILGTDTVWLNDSEKGVLASRVRNLFRSPQPPVDQVAEAAPPPLSPAVVPGGERAVCVPGECKGAALTEAAPEKPAVQPIPAYQDHQPRKLRVVALTGAIIVGQDGRVVRFRKKCTACGHEDSSWATQPILSGMMRAGFFCPKCRKHREVQLRGQQG